MDKFGNVQVFLTPQMAAILADNLPEGELEEAGLDVERTRKRLLQGAGGGDAPRDIASVERGYSENDGNERTGVWGGSSAANPSDYVHGYARGMTD